MHLLIVVCTSIAATTNVYPGRFLSVVSMYSLAVEDPEHGVNIMSLKVNNQQLSVHTLLMHASYPSLASPHL